MADLALDWGGDLVVTPWGDLGSVDGPDLTRQRIVRRLFTALRGYVWHQGYGAGLLQRIGRPAVGRAIAGIVRGQMLLEASVARAPPPQVAVGTPNPGSGLYVITITYVEAATGLAVDLRLTVPEAP